MTKGLVTVKKLTDDPGEWAAHILSEAKSPGKIILLKSGGQDMILELPAKNLEIFYLAKSEE